MKNYTLKLQKNNTCIVELNSLYDLTKEEQLDKLIKVFEVFCAFDFLMLALCVVNQGSQMLKINDVSIVGEKESLITKKKSYKLSVNVGIENIKEIIEIAAIEDFAIEIVPKKEKSQVNFLINDNGHTLLTFDLTKYCIEKVKEKLEKLL